MRKRTRRRRGATPPVDTVLARTVFISSRMEELVDERRAVYAATRDAGFAPTIFEIEPISIARDTIDAIVDRADLFVGHPGDGNVSLGDRGVWRANADAMGVDNIEEGGAPDTYVIKASTGDVIQVNYGTSGGNVVTTVEALRKELAESEGPEPELWKDEDPEGESE